MQGLQEPRFQKTYFKKKLMLVMKTAGFVYLRILARKKFHRLKGCFSGIKRVTKSNQLLMLTIQQDSVEIRARSVFTGLEILISNVLHGHYFSLSRTNLKALFSMIFFSFPQSEAFSRSLLKYKMTLVRQFTLKIFMCYLTG